MKHRSVSCKACTLLAALLNYYVGPKLSYFIGFFFILHHTCFSEVLFFCLFILISQNVRSQETIYGVRNKFWVTVPSEVS